MKSAACVGREAPIPACMMQTCVVPGSANSWHMVAQLLMHGMYGRWWRRLPEWLLGAWRGQRMGLDNTDLLYTRSSWTWSSPLPFAHNLFWP